MKRQIYDLSSYKLETMRPGVLYPVGLEECLPGDYFKHSVHALCRVTPQLSPIMHKMQLVTRSYFIPHRLAWASWEEFITGRTTPAPTFPQFAYNSGVAEFDRLAQCMGAGQVQSADDNPVPISAIPFINYNLLWNYWYRDQELQDELPTASVTLSDYVLRNVNWGRDYFTQLRPEPQVGAEVSIPISGTSDVAVTDSATGLDIQVLSSAHPYTPGGLQLQGYSGSTSDTTLTGTADLSTGASMAISDLREASAVQAFREKRMRMGSRYEEYLAADFGVKARDARLQNPEYLGGSQTMLNFSEIVQTAQGTDPVGELRGHGIAQLRSRPYKFFVPEHGYIMTLAFLRPEAIYSTGMPRHFLKTNMFDFYQHQFAHVGEQPVTLQEIYPGDDDAATVFGWGPRYEEYRKGISQVNGEFLSTLNYWHYARIFGTNKPGLNDSFIKCVPTDRVYADTSDSTDKMYVCFYHNRRARRPVTRNSTPSLRT